MLRSFTISDEGNVATMFALVVMVLLIAIGTAVDLLGANRSKVQLQGFTDAAILAAVSSGETQKKQLTINAKNNFDANNRYNWTVDFNGELINKNIFRLESKTNYNTVIMGMFGKPFIPVSVVAEAPVPSLISVNLTLVLDTTASMSATDMIAMKQSAKQLLQSLDEQTDTLRASIVPFAQYVNVGTGNRFSNWISIPATGTWNGCVVSRQDPWNNLPDYFGKKISAKTDVNCGAPVKEMTSDISNLEIAIDSLLPEGNTFIPAGIIWGWRMLDGSSPFIDLTNNDQNVHRVMILMTDGANTARMTSNDHVGFSSANSGTTKQQSDEWREEVNALTSELCNKVKAEGIKIYSVAYNMSSTYFDQARKVVEDCATRPKYYYDPSSTTELNNAFQDIASSLTVVKLSR